MSYLDWKIIVQECIEMEDHLRSCDEDGYCNSCGYQDISDDDDYVR